MKTLTYNSVKLRVLIAFVASLIILFHGRLDRFLLAFVSPSFYVALAVSFAVALLLIYLVHKTTIWLDVRWDWKQHTFQRTILQTLLGIVLPAVTDLLLITIYFNAIGQNIMKNGFLLVDYPIILSFLIVLNLYYLVLYLLKNEELSKYQEDNTRIVIDYNGVHANLHISDVLYFYRSGKIVKVVTVNGIEYAFNMTISNLEENYTNTNLCRINRSVIINLAYIEGFQSGYKRNTLQIIPKSLYQKYILDKNDEFFLVTGEHIGYFKNQFEKYKC